MANTLTTSTPTVCFSPARDQSTVSHMRVRPTHIKTLPDGSLHMQVDSGNVGFGVRVPPAPNRPAFTLGHEYILEFPKASNPFVDPCTAIYPAEQKPASPQKPTRSLSMSHTMTPFQFDHHTLRVQTDEHGQPWFNAKDVCAALALANPRDALAKHVEVEDVTKRDTLTSGGTQSLNYINESGLYALIMGSTKPEAKRFKRWVTSEVLPAIRKTGAYQAAPSNTPALPDFTNPAIAARAWAEQFEQREEEHHKRISAEAERDEAIRTKAHIGSSREASAMAKASAAVRENKRLREALGQSSQFATVRAVENKTGITVGERWRALRQWCLDNDVEPKEAPDSLYGMVKAWPAQAWKAVFGVILADIFSASVLHV